ncbi:hypothetical protein QJU11_09945 [Pasteurella atlantica]|uniref:hypothetical protein n=1 Tax=Phocoenobacter atlanticus TaxID=3416742 RepID=UPI002771AA03|nr:hypothetical protein [Pasteurella atlantica]MDP8042512.1 hypothetical protein [Pasteurella atlantica]
MKKTNLTLDDIKTVYYLLKQREIHPKGSFDDFGRFFLKDAELVNVRKPSRQYNLSQMNAGRTLKFVKATAEKYDCQNIEELLSCFNNILP